jgi:MFS family permease
MLPELGLFSDLLTTRRGVAVTGPHRNLFLLSIASAGWAFSFGLGAPLASRWLDEAGMRAQLVGLNTSLYYVGVALASLLAPWLMRRGDRACLVSGMLLDAVTTAVFPWFGVAWVWFLLRFLGGVGSALALIPMETRVNANAPPDRRARDFGIYAFSVASGIGLGTFLGLLLYPMAPRLAFALGGVMTLAAAVLAAAGLPPSSAPVTEATPESRPSLWRERFSLGTAWVQGFLEGGMLTFLALYLGRLGHTDAVVSGLMGGLFLGVVLIQVPVAVLADRLGRHRVVLSCHLLLLVGLICLPFCGAVPALAVLLFLVGATCAALYPLGLALLGERVPASAMAQANAWYLASNCAGSLSGPLVLGLTIDLAGQRAQFVVGGLAVVLVMVAAGRPLFRAIRHPRQVLDLFGYSSPSHRPSHSRHVA